MSQPLKHTAGRHPRGTAFWIACLSLASAFPATAQQIDDLLDLSLEQLANIEITTASKIPEPLSKTAATVCVITASDLRRMGARTIYDALAQVPGLAVGSGQFGENFIAVRGLRSSWSEKVLLLLDGHLLNDVRSGSATFQFIDDLPVDNIARIEVVRGPGSALYGANAFLGVINIITRLSQDIDTLEATVSGEFESTGTVARDYNLLTGRPLGSGWQGGLNLNLLDAPGAELEVDADAFGRSGQADNHKERLDAQGLLSNGAFTLRGRYLQREAGDSFGGLNVLNSQSKQKVESYFLNAEYHIHPAEAAELILQAYVDHQDTANDYRLPAGSIPATSPLFPWNGTGLIANLLAKESITGAEARFDYKGISGHAFTAGLAWRHEKLYDPRTIANYNPAPLPQATDVSAVYNWIDAAKRNISSLYVQDLWDIRPDLRATLGARYDHYQDFGATVNPRVGLSWQASPSLVTRITYGSAFRAPSFYEQHVKNNSEVLGNPGLDAEEIDTWEIGLRWTDTRVQTGIALFHSDIVKLIDIPSSDIQYQHLGDATINGVELEGRYRLQTGFKLCANYSYADPDFNGVEPQTWVARHQLNFSTDIPLAARLSWHIHARWQSETPRAVDDSRPSLDSVWLVDSAVTAQWQRWDFTAAVYNATDSDYAATAPTATLADDYTAAGRSILLKVKYALD
jgi:outer membrane cobalamin receptor